MSSDEYKLLEMKKTTFNLAFLCLMTASMIFSKVHAQSNETVVTSDFESWSSIGVKAKLSKKLDASLEQGIRLAHNSTQLDQVLTDLGLSYELYKNLNFGVGMRYIYDRSNNGTYDNDLRYNLDLSYKQKFDRLGLKYRIRYQNKNEIGSFDTQEAKKYLRLKIGAIYNIKNWKLDPKFSTEIYRNIESGGQFDKLRFTLGTDYSIKKYGELGIFYRLEKDLNSTVPKTTYITGLKYTYTFKTKKK